MSEAWFVLDDRGRIGPLTLGQLIDTLETYPDRDEVFVKRDGQKSWHRAADIPDLTQIGKPSIPARAFPTINADFRPNPVSSAQAFRWHWLRYGAVVGLILGGLNLALFHQPNGNNVVSYIFGYLIGSAALCAVIGFLTGAARDFQSRRPSPKPSISEPEGGSRNRLNVISMHWHGRYPLWISYWVINVIGSIAAVVIAALIAAALTPKSGYDPLAVFFTITSTWFCIVTITIWQIVGVWRSANNYIVRRSSIGRKAPWAGVAKIAVVLGVIQLVRTLASSGLPELSEATRIAFMGDPDIPEYSFRIMRNGTEVEITGGFKYGLTDEFSKLLKASRQISVVHLTSFGGRIGEAEKLYRLIRAKQLATYVPTECLSACTIAFAGGKERYIARNATVGFHAPAFPGTSDEVLRASVAEQTEIYIASGFSADFVSKALRTPSSEMWKPSASELLAAGVITGISNGAQFAASGMGDITKEEMAERLAKALPMLDAMRERLPQSYDSVVDAFYSSYVAGHTQADSIAAARAKLLPILASPRPLASDDVLSDLARLLADQYRALRLKSPALCYLYASGADATRNFTDEMPPALLGRELDLNQRVVRTAATRTPAAAQNLILSGRNSVR
jgi:hypothetical protein